MSGVAAVDGARDPAIVEQMLDRLGHRGGSAVDTFVNEELVLGCSAGDEQAFFADDNGERAIAVDSVITYIGGAPVEQAGPRPDPRALLVALDEQGLQSLSGIDGSFALLALTRRGLVAARDRFGLKPLYYARAGDRIFFASELKALADLASFDELAAVPPGTYYRADTGFVAYSDASAEQPVPPSADAAGAELLGLLEQAVQRCSPGRGRLGIFLSGGLDSSLVAALASRLFGPLRTFTAGAEGSQDLQHARIVAKHLGADHMEHQYTQEEMLAVLPRVIYHLESFDWSLVRSAIANYIVARLAREHEMDFVLVGEGADELFGGYHYLKERPAAQQAQELERLLSTGHNIGFQRVDRMTSAHSLGCAMPFMDRRVVQFARGVPVEWKIHGPNQVEKWLLRRAAGALLPDDIIWRRKDQFSKGAGSAESLVALAETHISDQEFAREREPFPGYVLRSKEELYYYRIFRDFFPGQFAFESVGRWNSP